MRTAKQLKTRLDSARFIHLLVVFMIAMFLYLFTTLPERWWILLTVLVSSAGIEPGLIIRRSIQRITGTLSALIIITPLIYLLHFNYRLVPVCFILAIIGLNVAAVNTRRYDISVFFITLMVFLLLAQTAKSTSLSGSFDMLINRGLCTLIGVSIVGLADYYLFQSYKYSHKLYLFHQKMLYAFFQRAMARIMDSSKESINTFLFIERLRDEVIMQFAPIAVSSENLKLENKLAPTIIHNLEVFQSTIWEIRRLLFALAFAKFILQSTETTQKHQQHFNRLMEQAKAHFIKL